MSKQGTAQHALDYHLFQLLHRAGRVWLGLLVALALIALVLGTVGYHQYGAGRNPPPSAANDLYQALQLFVVSTPTFNAPPPIALDSARFLAAVVTFSTVISVLGKVFFNQIQAMRLWVLGRRHVILCGLGAKGIKLVEALRERFQFVVVIEADADHDDLPQCRALGAIVLIGSSTDAWQLRKARVYRADVLLSVFRRDDRLNVETAVLACEMSQDPASRVAHLRLADRRPGPGRDRPQARHVHQGE